MHMLPIAYTALILSALTVGGIVALRSLRNLAIRAVVFVLLCAVAFRLSFWLSERWDLDPVGLGYAWAVALLIVAGVEALRFWRRKRTIA